MVVESRSVVRNAKNVRGLSQVVRVLFSLCSFLYVPTILSESLAQARVVAEEFQSLQGERNSIYRHPTADLNSISPRSYMLDASPNFVYISHHHQRRRRRRAVSSEFLSYLYFYLLRYL